MSRRLGEKPPDPRPQQEIVDNAEVREAHPALAIDQREARRAAPAVGAQRAWQRIAVDMGVDEHRGADAVLVQKHDQRLRVHGEVVLKRAVRASDGES